MRLGLAVPTLGFQGGLERHAHDLARALVARGHEVRLLHGERIGRDAQAFASAFTSKALLGSKHALSELEAVWVQKAAAPEELERFGDLPLVLAVHDHDLTCVRTSRMLLVSREACDRPPGVPCVLHGCVVVRDRAGRLPLTLANPFSLRARLAALSRRARLVACSRYLARTLVEAGAPAERVSFIHPVPPAEELALVPRPLAQRVLVSAQLVHGKGVDLAIEAMRQLPQATLEIAGDGPSRGALEQQARRVAPGRVTFLGYVPPAQVTSLYDRASVALVPSRWPEPFGLIGLEAMRRARPVAAALHGGIVEWLPRGGGGRGFTPGDTRAMAQAVQQLLDDAAAGEAALAFVQENFQQARSVEAALELLRKAA
ncbi:MAG: glycosyltransferase family 4 protein [Deltaproteobacteria bacterium]|nr:glycosyltransferase family 4 protein [Deltaproteobacteria bacterium]